MSNDKTQGKMGAGKVLLIIAAVVIFMWHMSAVDDAKHIVAVLAQNKQLTTQLLNGTNTQKIETEEDIDRAAGYFDDYVEKARQIDTRDCPREFADTYSRYISAIADDGAALHAHPHIPSGEEAFVAGLIKGLQGDPMGEVRTISESMNSWGKTVRERSERVNQAEKELIEVATRYELYAWPSSN